MAVQNAIGEGTNITISKKFHSGWFKNHRFLWLLMRGLLNTKNFFGEIPKKCSLYKSEVEIFLKTTP